MAHQLDIDDREGLLDSTSLSDFIDLFFGGRDSRFIIEVQPTFGRPPNPSIRGLCATNGSAFRITLYAKNISEHVKLGLPVGGNTTLAKTLPHALYLVLTHELRHAYQQVFHGNDTSFNRGKYKGRASEIDARRHVDESYEAVCAFVGIQGSRAVPAGPAEQLLEFWSEAADEAGCIPLTDDEVWEQAFELPGDPDANHERLSAGLVIRGLSLMC